MDQPRFGSAGNPQAFYAAGYKHSVDIPAWLADQGLTAYEYACGRGVNIGGETAARIGAMARRHGVAVSLHAPYYINLASSEVEIRQKSLLHLQQSLLTAEKMGAQRVVFHVGASAKQERSMALDRSKEMLGQVLEERERLGLGHITLCPETMGKRNQIGTLDEILQLCTCGPNLLPTVDFGHLHAVSGGGFTALEEYEAAFSLVGQRLGERSRRQLHIHFSKVEFGPGGEKRHGVFADTHLGPPPEVLAAVCARQGYAPWIICESAGTQAEDAAYLRQCYTAAVKGYEISKEEQG